MHYTALRPLLFLAVAFSTVFAEEEQGHGHPGNDNDPKNGPQPTLTIPGLDPFAPSASPDPPAPKSTQGVTTGTFGNATVVTDNPAGASYRAIFPTNQFFPTSAGLVKGIVLAQTNEGGTGVTFDIKILNLPAEGGPYVYHIHTNPVPEDGNCTDTMAHLDPFERGETPPCDPDLPQTCQVGDLAGKHGAITTTPFRTTYSDDYTATGYGLSFIGDLSVVVHFANLTRITCANLYPLDPNSNSLMTTSIDDMLDAAYSGGDVPV